MFLDLLIRLIIIVLYSSQEYDIYDMHSSCWDAIKNSGKQTYLSESNTFLLEIMRGKIPIKIKDSLINNFDLDLIKRINKNIPCLYKFKNNNYSNNKTNGLFLGAGINLFNYNSQEFEEILNNMKISPLNNKIYKELFDNIKTLGYKSLLLFNKPFPEIDKFNKAVMEFTISRYLKEINDTKIYKSPFVNGVLSVFFQLYQGNDVLKRYLGYSQTQTSYIVEHLPESSLYSRLIQSKLIQMMEGNIKYNSNHIFVVVPLFLFEDNELAKIKDLINWIYTSINLNYILNPNRISILVIKDDDYLNYTIDYNNKKNNLEDLFKSEYKNNTQLIDLEKIYENINLLFKDNRKPVLFENKIAILFLNYGSNLPKNFQNIIERNKKLYSIQTIPVINIDNSKYRYNDIFKYNIFYDFSENIYAAPIKLAISNMHINVDFTELNTNEKGLNNLIINDNETPIYLEVNINKGKELEYYEISLEIFSTTGYNLFISETNPYPNIINNKNNFLKYYNNLNPKIVIKTVNITKFYIGIEGKLHFNLNIKRQFSKNNTEYEELVINNGEYEDVLFNYSKFQFKDKHLTIQTFSEGNNEFNLYSSIFKNESIENMMKYFTRGIDIYNTNDRSFLNYELFLYLYGEAYFINRVYRDQENNYYFGRYFKISDYTPYQLKSAGFSRLTLNKLYYFLKINNVLAEEAPAVSFDEEELKLIFDIIYENYVSELIYKIKRYPNCIPFENQTPIMKFVLFCLYFTYYYDNNIVRNIINLSLNEPKYSEVLKYLKDKNQENDRFIINYIKQMEQEDKLEKIMVNIILGKSLALSETGINFIKNFYNYMSKSKTKISISVYDTLESKNKIENVVPFLSTSTFKLEEFTKYNKSAYGQRSKYNNTQYMNFNKIIDFGLSKFYKYDNGIKKKIVMICDENIVEDRYTINNKLKNLNNEKHVELIDNQIDLLLVTSINYENGEIPDLFNKNIMENQNYIDIPYSLYENYFHVNNLNKKEDYLDDLGRVIKDSSIKINAGIRFINDFYQGKMSYYEINYQDYKQDVMVIKTNLSNFKIYSSLTNPFPNSIWDNPIYTSDNDDAIVISNDKLSGKIYLGIEPINSIQKQKVEIFTCESYSPNKNCKFVGNSGGWYLFLFIFFVFCLLFIIYKCKLRFSSDNNSKKNKRLNVFDNVK